MSSLYIWVALLSAGTLGMVTVLDKRLASNNLPTLASFYMGTLIALVGYATVALISTGIPANIATDRMVAAIASGLCWGGALAMMFLGFKYEEASRASAIIHTFPVFVAILAVLILGETLGPGQWIAIIVVVAGAFLISLKPTDGGGMFQMTRAFPILIGASLFTASALLTGKYALAELPVWFVYSIRNYGMAVVFVFLWRPGAFRQLFRAVRNWRTLLLLFAAEFSLAPLAVALNVAAISMGPISLVATLTATRPIFVFIYGTIFSLPALKLLDEPLDRPTLAVKLVAIIMVVGGIVALTLL
jgi:drug/metabolite transporter (DMT)-like permease